MDIPVKFLFMWHLLMGGSLEEESNVDDYRDTIMSDKNMYEGMSGEKVIVLECAMKHGFGEFDIKHAINNAVSARYRNFCPPAHIALAGLDLDGRLIEVLCTEREDGTLIVYHAMKLTAKMAHELEL